MQGTQNYEVFKNIYFQKNKKLHRLWQSSYAYEDRLNISLHISLWTAGLQNTYFSLEKEMENKSFNVF